MFVSPGSSVPLQTEGEHISVESTIIAAANQPEEDKGIGGVTLTSSFGITVVAIAVAVAGPAASPPSQRIAKIPRCTAEASKVE